MRFFELLGLQHVVAMLFPTLVFLFLFFVGLGYFYFRRPDSDKRMTEVVHKYPDGFESRNAPFPLVLTLIIIGALVWALAYTVAIGLFGVRI